MLSRKHEEKSRWGAALHSLGEEEQALRRLHATLKAMTGLEGEARRLALQDAAEDVRRAHARLCWAIHKLNAVAPQPSAAPPHQPVDKL